MRRSVEALVDANEDVAREGPEDALEITAVDVFRGGHCDEEPVYARRGRIALIANERRHMR